VFFTRRAKASVLWLAFALLVKVPYFNMRASDLLLNDFLGRSMTAEQNATNASTDTISHRFIVTNGLRKKRREDLALLVVLC
jgi:hypothetical protein